VFALFIPACNPPTFLRLQVLGVAAILTTGRRTISNLLRTLGHRAGGAPSSYHRVLSQARWSGLRLAALLTRFVLRRYWPAGTVSLVGDDTVSAHPGRKVYGVSFHLEQGQSVHVSGPLEHCSSFMWLTLLMTAGSSSFPLPWSCS
jgi:hypothetical protein